MASAISVANIRGTTEKSKNRRLGALLDLSRGEPLLLTKQKPQKESERNVPPPSEASQSRAQGSRVRQSTSAHQTPAKPERTPRPPLTHGIRSGPTNPRTGMAAAKPIIAMTGHAEPSKQPRNTIQKKQSNLLKEPLYTKTRNQPRFETKRTASSSSITNLTTAIDQVSSLLDRSITESPEQNPLSPQSVTHNSTTQPARIYPELDRYRDVQVPTSTDPLETSILHKLTTEGLPPPTPLFSGASSYSQISNFSLSPSTRFSGSPGPSPYSRDTTPTSMCSQSPGLVVPVRLTATRMRQASPAETRPPVTRRRAGSVSNDEGPLSSDPLGLAAVREASASSSSSNSTVRADDKDGKPHRGLTLSPPNPPSRKSSRNSSKDRSTDDTKSTKLSEIPAQSVMRSPSPSKATRSIHSKTSGPTPLAQRRPTPPFRPSRDGTPDPNARFGGSAPIIHTKSSSTSVTERRQSGQLLPSSLPRTITHGPARARTASAQTSLAREPIPATRSATVPCPQTTTTDTGKANTSSSPSIPTSKPKFSLFRRRTKSGSEAPQLEKKDRIPRRGPAAGTGHEGYGSVGAIKRRSSTTLSLQRGLPGNVSPSDYLSGCVTADQFLLERMNPVIIAGGAVVENQNDNFDLTRSESAQAVPRGQHSRKVSIVSPGTKEDGRHALWPSPILRQTANSRRPSDTSEPGEPPVKSSLTYRRSIRRLLSHENLSISIPGSIHSRAHSAASTATTIHIDGSLPEAKNGAPQAKVPSKGTAKTSKSPRKWNLFGRSQATAVPKTQTKSVSVTIEPTRKRPAAFYTMIESPEQDTISVYRRDSDISPTTEVPLQRGRENSTSSVISPVAHSRPGAEVSNNSPKLDDNVSFMMQLDERQSQPRVEQDAIEPLSCLNKRLPPIPKVATSRLSPKSFSRPFNQISGQLEPSQSTLPGQDFTHNYTIFPKPLALDTSYTESLKSKIVRGDISSLGKTEQEFFAFPSDNGSFAWAGSSGLQGPNIFGWGPHIAQIPEPSTPLGEDEIWDEFNDLLEEYPPSPTSSCGAPFLLETYNSNVAEDIAKPIEPPMITTQLVQDSRDSVSTITALNWSDGPTASTNHDTSPPDLKLPAISLPIPESALGDDNHHSHGIESNQEPNAPSHDTAPVNEGDMVKLESKRDSGDSKRTSGSSRISDETPLSKVNLRVGSMTVSKWLTFGHVLFSPVRENLFNDDASIDRQSILVIDGLGNDDWSYYAAETYPAANFYNLSPRAPVPKEQQATSSFPLSPPNHYQIQFPSHADRFPFGPDSFTAIVIRFPSTAPEAHYRNIISEAQRVLKPGGFIELSVLDVDLNNVGSRTRRAVRHLKEQISIQHPDFCLSSTADVVLRLLGNKGFADIKTCRVGVPVASWITNASNKNKKKDERSLAEMMDDKSELGDENITQMVSKVGRWWYNRCYEVPTGMTKSIWHDRALLAECEEWGTSLKLMVCHARIPEGRARIATI